MHDLTELTSVFLITVDHIDDFTAVYSCVACYIRGCIKYKCDFSAVCVFIYAALLLSGSLQLQSVCQHMVAPCSGLLEEENILLQELHGR